MKNPIPILLLFILFAGNALCKENKTDSLLTELDKVISERSKYSEMKKTKISELKRKKNGLKKIKDLFEINREIINQYNTFICDSAELYINENLALAKKMNDKDLILESSFRLFYIYSLSGLFFASI